MSSKWIGGRKVVANPAIGICQIAPDTPLMRRLKQMSEDGIAAPCSGLAEWYSIDPDVRNAAALVCSRCPAKKECLDAAISGKEKWGVWGGRDFTIPSHAKSETIANLLDIGDINEEYCA